MPDMLSSVEMSKAVQGILEIVSAVPKLQDLRAPAT